MRIDKALSATSYLLLAFLWIVTIVTISQLPERIPIHFDMHNRADGFGSKTTLWLFPIIATFIIGLMTVVKKHPESLNYPVAITPENRERQQSLAFGLLSAIACVVPALFCFILYSTWKYVREGSFDFSILLLVAGILLPIIIYFYLAHKAR
jgi:uncharacterized membrane protein